MLKIILEYKESYSTEIFKKEDIGYYSFLDAEKWPYSINYIIREYTNYIDKTEPDSLDIFSDNKHLHINYKGYKLDVLQCLVKEDSFINYLTDTNFIPEKKLHSVVDQFMQYIDQEEKKDMKMDSRYYKGFTCNIEASTGYGSFTGECKEIGFFTKRVHLQSVRQLFDEAVDTYLGEKEMKVTFTYGNTVKIILTQDEGGFYVYTPKNQIISSIKFFSVKDAILFFSEFLPIKVYDKEENSLSFEVTLDYKDKNISFYMKDEDKTKRAWTNYTTENKGFNDVLRVNAKIDDSIDDVVWYFIKWVKTTPMEEKKKERHFTSAILFRYKGYQCSPRLSESGSNEYIISGIYAAHEPGNQCNYLGYYGKILHNSDIWKLRDEFEEYLDKNLC